MKKIVCIILFGIFSLSIHSQNRLPDGKERALLRTQLEALFMQDQLFRRLYQDAEKK